MRRPGEMFHIIEAIKSKYKGGAYDPYYTDVLRATTYDDILAYVGFAYLVHHPEGIYICDMGAPLEREYSIDIKEVEYDRSAPGYSDLDHDCGYEFEIKLVMKDRKEQKGIDIIGRPGKRNKL